MNLAKGESRLQVCFAMDLRSDQKEGGNLPDDYVYPHALFWAHLLHGACWHLLRCTPTGAARCTMAVAV